MIVQAPDNKTIDFGDMLPDQVTSAMQKLYPVNQDLGMEHGLTSGFAQGATFGLGDEAIAGLTSLRSAFDKGKLSDVSGDYNQALNIERGAEKNFNQQHPVLSLGSQLAGGLATGIAGGQTASGQALASSLGSGSLPARMLKNAAVSATSGGLYGFGSGEGDAENRLQSAEHGALVGGAVGSAIPAVGAALNKVGGGIKNIATGLKAQDAEAVQNSASDLFDAASPYYQQMRGMGDKLKSNASQNLISNIDSALNNTQNKFIPELNPKTMVVVNSLKDAAKNGDLGVSDVDQYRRLLSRIGGSEDGFSAGVAKKALDDTLNGLGGSDLASGSTKAVDLLNQARAASSKAFRYQDIADILSKADGDPNKIKSGLTRFLDSKPIGYNQDEIQALRQAANTNNSEAMMKFLGRFGFDPKNVFMPMIGAGAMSAGFGTPAAAGLATAGTLSRQAYKYGTRGKAEDLLNLVASRGQNMPSVMAQNAAQKTSPLALGVGVDAGNLPNLLQRLSMFQ